MLAEKAKESINQAIAYELQNIVKNYGPTYASNHEGYAVLKEEIEEASDALKSVNQHLNILWKSIRVDYLTEESINQVKKNAVFLAQEAVQIVAVCERFIETVK